jgi:flagellar M-ring protein FliF
VGGIRAQVVADIDFTVTEKTSETFDPEKRQIRSEVIQKEERIGAELAVGVPGALSNQPPPAGVVSAPASGDAGQPGDAETGGSGAVERPQASSERSTHNYELDKTISHTRMSTGEVRRLSVAVVIDDLSDGNQSAQSTSAGNLERLTELVKQAVGFDETRGDTVSVVSIPFTTPEQPEPLPEAPLWERAWVMDLLKHLVAAAAVLALIFFVLRPTMRALAARGSQLQVLPGQAGMDGVQGSAAGGQLSGPAGLIGQSAGSINYEQDVETARTMVANDPKRVAQVVKVWVGEDG